MINITDLQILRELAGYQLIQTALCFFFIFVTIAIAVSILGPRKSQDYRKLLTDMYVAGKIKKLAKKEDINLAEEEKNFNLWCKKKRLNYLDLDRTIEEEMKEKITEEEPKK